MAAGRGADMQGQGLSTVPSTSRFADARGGGELHADGFPAVLAQDPALSILGFLEVSDLGTFAACARSAAEAAGDDAVWCSACRRLWAGKQCSFPMRQWLAEVGDEPCGIRTEMSPVVSRSESCEGVSQQGEAGIDRGLEVSPSEVCSWRQRFAFAINDRHRCCIRLQELCEDAALDPETDRPYRRRWHLQVRFERWHDKEVVFHPTGGTWQSFDINHFQEMQFEELSWRPADHDYPGLFDLPDDATSQAGGSFPFIRVPSLPFLLRVCRTADWGWALVPAGGPPVIHLVSRQLSLRQHEEARLTSAEFFTLYLQASSKGCRAHGPHGKWEVMAGYHGTMPARSWIGATVVFTLDGPAAQSGSCSISFCDDAGGCESISCFVETAVDLGEAQGLLDAYLGADLQTSRFRMAWRRATPTGDDTLPPMLLLVDGTASRHSFGSHSQPACIPPGLPPLDAHAQTVDCADLDGSPDDAVAESPGAVRDTADVASNFS